MWSSLRCARPRWHRALPRCWKWCARARLTCIRIRRSGRSSCASTAKTARRRLRFSDGGVMGMAMTKPLVGDELVGEMAADDETPQERPEELRLIEALLFAAGEPLDEKTLRTRLPEG